MNSLNPFVSRSLIDELFNDVNPGYFIKQLHGDPLPNKIKLDVKEIANEYIVHAEIPGAGKENIHVDLDGNIVSIRAQIAQVDTENKEEKFLRTERYYGEVARRFQLATEIDETLSKARYDDGVLTLNLAKKLKKAGQRIVIE